MNRSQEALVLLIVLLSCVLGLYLVAINNLNPSSVLTLKSRSSEPWYDDDDDWYVSEPGVFSYGYSGSVIYPSPTPDVNPTCQALERLATLTPSCRPNDQCNGVHCTILFTGDTFDLTVEPCHNPPAVHVVGRNSSGSVIVNETLTHSRSETLIPDIVTVDVNVEQSPSEDSILINVTAHAFGQTVPLIPETRIPLNRQQCGFIPHTSTPPQPTSRPPSFVTTVKFIQPSTSTPLHTTHSQASSSSPSIAPPTKPPSGASLTVAVAVPVSVIFGLVGIVVLVVAIVLVIRRRKRLRREYHFQRMTFSDDKDDDDDDEDL